MSNTNKVEVIGATVAAAATSTGAIDAFVTTSSHVMQFVIALLTLAWWVRLWVKRPGIKPPGEYLRNHERG